MLYMYTIYTYTHTFLSSSSTVHTNNNCTIPAITQKHVTTLNAVRRSLPHAAIRATTKAGPKPYNIS